MRKRMNRSKRREHLLQIMNTIHKQATTQDDFTAEGIAKEAAISSVWLYKLVGLEFQELRSQLPGSRRTVNETISNLRSENAELRKQLEELRTKSTAILEEELAGGIFMIERLDEENRVLHSQLTLLRKRLEEDDRQVILQIPGEPVDRSGLRVVGGSRRFKPFFEKNHDSLQGDGENDIS